MSMWCLPGVFVLLSLSACGGKSIGSTGNEVASAVDGASAFAMCANCHTNKAGAPNRIGPNLYGVVGRKAGESTGFAYSSALRDSGIVWDEQSLDAYLSAPTKRVPGTKMTYSTTDAAKRHALIQYLSATAP